MTERQSIVAYLKTQKFPTPLGGAEDLVNQTIDDIISQIERGAHRVVEGRVRR